MTTIRTTVLSVLAAAIGTLATLQTADARDVAERCDACFERRVTRFLQRKAATCSASGDAALVNRLQRKLRRCARRRACKTSGQGGKVSRSQAAAAIRGQLGCGIAQSVSLDGPVGEAPPAVEPAAGATFADVAAYCAPLDDEYDGPNTPPLMALPAPATLPDWCDEDAAYRDIVVACGTPSVVVVSARAGRGVPDGSPASPFATISDALAACAGPCHVLVAPGTYVGNIEVPPCTIIEGGVDVAGGAIVPGAVRPQLRGRVDALDDAILLARLDVRAERTLGVDGDVLVSDSVLRGGHAAGSGGRSPAVGPRICRSHLAGNSSGFDISWGSRRLWVAGSAVSACYEGLGLSWGSGDLQVLDSVIYGGNAAIATFASSGITVRDNYLGGGTFVVNVHVLGQFERAVLGSRDADDYPEIANAVVEDNRIAGFGCAVDGFVGWPGPPPGQTWQCLPDADPALDITVAGNVYE